MIPDLETADWKLLLKSSAVRSPCFIVDSSWTASATSLLVIHFDLKVSLKFCQVPYVPPGASARSMKSLAHRPAGPLFIFPSA